MFVTILLSRFMTQPSELHFKASKRVQRYIKRTLNLAMYGRCDEIKLIGYTNSDWGGSVDYMKSSSGYAFSIGSCMIS